MSNSFFDLYGKICTEEQLYRMSMYPYETRKIVQMSNYEILYKSISFIFQNDHNWIISLSRFLDNIDNYTNVYKSSNNKRLNDELIPLFIEAVSDTSNYFDIKNYSDLLNYENKKNEICLNILNSKFKNIPDNIIENCSKRNKQIYSSLKMRYAEKFNAIKTLIKGPKNNIDQLTDIHLKNEILFLKDNLYKFALLEYKFGISLDDAEILLERYGTDIDELPAGTLKDYLELLNEIVYCDNIQEVIKFAIENDTLKEPWKGFPNAREAEGKILDLFAELYNQTLYKPTPEDKEDYLESYTDPDGKQYCIEIYKVKEDFAMDIRVEGAFNCIERDYTNHNGNVINYANYYNQEQMQYHGNSESYLNNSNIAVAESDTSDIIVGYEKIYRNQLAGASPKVQSISTNDGLCTASYNYYFSIYGVENIKLRTPNHMIDNTRTTGFSICSTCELFLTNFNEFYKDKIVSNKNGEKEIYMPSYVVWIEDDTDEERKNPEWKQKREKNKRWLHTKQAAAQLGVPIVIIDREYFAKRELKKTELMKKLITEEKIDEKEFGNFLEKYTNLTKPELIKQLFTTIENNKNGIANRFPSYFSKEYCIDLRTAILNSISNMKKTDAINCLNALIDISYKEKSFYQNTDKDAIRHLDISFYGETIKIAKNKLKELTKNFDSDEELSTNIDLLKMYFSSGVSDDDVNSCSIIPDSYQPTQEGTSK